jgi:hypothetical protein
MGRQRGRPSLVHRLLNPFGFAPSQLAVFQGASDEHPAPVLHAYRSPSNAPAQNWCGMRPPTASPARTALPAAHFERYEAQGI